MDPFPAPFAFLSSRQTLAWLLFPALLLPVAVTILCLFGQMFTLFDDALFASILTWSAWILALIWFFTLVLLLLCTVLFLLREAD